MDISKKYNVREKAEHGVFMPLCDDYTGEPIEKDPKKAPGFIVRGTASRTVQSRLTEMKRKPDGADKKEIEKSTLESLHETQVNAAMPYIARAVNIEIDGEDVGDNEDLIRKALDLTYPDLQFVKDEKGETVMTEGKDDSGNTISFPKFEIVNTTFAAQVTIKAGDTRGFLGKT